MRKMATIDHIFKPSSYLQTHFTTNNLIKSHLLKFSYKSCKRNTKIDAQKIMYLSNYKQSTIQHFDCSKRDAIISSKFLHANFRLRPLSSPVTSIPSSSSSLALLSRKETEPLSLSLAVTRERISREGRSPLPEFSRLALALHFHVGRGRRGNGRGAPHDPRRRSIALRPTSERVCSDVGAGPVERISAVSRRALFNLHFICFRSGSPLFWHAHMRTEGGVPHGDLPRETRPDSFAIG